MCDNQFPSYSTNNDSTSIYTLFTKLQKEVFAEIQHAQEGEMDEEQFMDVLPEIHRNTAGEFADKCGSTCAKKFVEDYGVFYALKFYSDEGYNMCDYRDEDRFYRLLLSVLLSLSPEVRELLLTYEAYQTYCEANPLED